MISQLTVFLENEPGRLSALTRAIAEANVNMYALFLADTADFGVARIFCDTPNVTSKVLTDAGWRATVTPVLGVRVPDQPGGLASLLEFLDEKKVNVEYGYCFAASDGTAIDVLKTSSGPEVETELQAAGFQIVTPEELYEQDR